VDGFSVQDSFLKLTWDYVLPPQINLPIEGTNAVLPWTSLNCYLDTIPVLGATGSNAIWTALNSGSPYRLPIHSAQQQYFRLISP